MPTTWVADYTNSAMDINALKSAGVVGVCRYLSRPQQNTVWKRVTQSEYHNLVNAGIHVVLNWEYDAQDWLGGVAQGKQDATQAVAEARAVGYNRGVIPGSADFNMTQAQWNGPGKQYAAAFAGVLGDAGYVPGVYSHRDVLEACHSLGHFGMFWQSMSTSYGFSPNRNATQSSIADLWQRLPQRTIAGNVVDYNQIITNKWNGDVVDMNLTDQVPTPGGTKRVQDLLVDVWAVVMMGRTEGGPLTDSWLAKTVQGIANGTTVALSADQVTQLANDVAAALVAAHSGLTQADLDSVATVVHTQLTKLSVAVGA